MIKIEEVKDKMEKYKNRAIDIMKSLVFKIDLVDVFMNQQLKYMYGIEPPENKYESVYYKNLQGIYTEFNEDVLLQSLDTGLIFKLERNKLSTHPLTFDELGKRDVFYRNVLEDNKGQETLINGILNNISEEELINSQDLTVLRYDKRLIKEQGLDLILEVENVARDFISKTYNPNLAYEDRYIPTIIAVAK